LVSYLKYMQSTIHSIDAANRGGIGVH